MWTIRRYHPIDKNRLILCLSGLRPDLPKDTNILNNLDRLIRERESIGIHTLVFEENEDVVGTASYFIEPKVWGNVCHVEDVAVIPSCRGKGVGRKLLSYINNIAKNLGCYKVILNCSVDNIVFYEKCGFKRNEVEMRYDIP
mgnify:CR=1 FL=1